jgi:hypothetical protein
MGERKDGLSVEHIPFAMPEKRCALHQNWKKLTFLHWEIDPEVLRKHLPTGLELDLFEGKAYVGCIPFVMEKVRPHLLPWVPGISTFGETNIRTYVTKNGVPGVFFLTLEAQSRITCFYANRRYGLTYRHAKVKVSGDIEQSYHWSSKRTKGGYHLQGSSKSVGEARQAKENTLEYFLFERYSLYTERKGILHRGYTHHDKWWYYDGQAQINSNTLVEPYDLAIKDPKPPDHIHISQGVEVVTWHITPITGE